MIRTIYLAGPYSNPDSDVRSANVDIALATADAVSRLGLFPFIPHLFHYWDKQYHHDYEFWMNQDAVWIVRCDSMLLYAESPGALKDAEVAKQFDIPVYRSLQEVAQAVLNQSNR